MARRYFDELLELSATYESVGALGEDRLEGVARAQRDFNQRPSFFFGSGGAIALAHLAAGVHARNSVHAAQALTPLSVVMGGSLKASGAAVGLFSARARHPDVRLAARAARTQPGNRVLLLTQLSAETIDSRLLSLVDEVVTLPRTSGDGFLATNSLLAMGGAWLRAAGVELPQTLPRLDQGVPAWPEHATRALILYGPDQLPAAYDLEARLSETGLLDVQLADLRNMAHGRHVGLLRRADSTVVVSMGDPSSRALLDRTLDALGPSLSSIDLSTELSGPAGSLDTMAASMLLVGQVACKSGVDPGRPRVASAGRRLYHLPWAQSVSSIEQERAVRTKAHAAGMTTAIRANAMHWTAEWDLWLDVVQGREVDGLVLDYDGTCVATKVRTQPPIEDVQRQIIRLLEGGVRIGIASGRGPSVISELRRWIPRDRWESVVVGIYNGGLVQPLSLDAEGGTAAEGELLAAVSLLWRRLVGDGWALTARRTQLTLERPRSSAADLVACASSILAPEFASSLKVLRSGHSVDIVPAATTKLRVLHHLGLDPERTLCLGDQGDYGGNDFDLLSCSPLTLSVDTVSADPSRCWNLSTDGESGPTLLARYLKAVSVGGKRATFRWRVRSR